MVTSNLTCMAERSRSGWRGIRTRSCLRRPMRNSVASNSARRGDTVLPDLEHSHNCNHWIVT